MIFKFDYHLLPLLLKDGFYLQVSPTNYNHIKPNLEIGTGTDLRDNVMTMTRRSISIVTQYQIAP